MRGLTRATPIVTLAAALAGATCAFPTDKSDALYVTVHMPKQVVLRGERLSLQAYLWQRTAGGADSAEIKNVVFQWTTDNDLVATVKDEGFGSAQVTGVTSGIVTLTARAPAFEKSQTAYVTMRVANPLEVDSVRPSLVRFGDTITVYGVGVDSIFLAFLQNATLFDYPLPGILATRTRDSLGFSTATFWVTPPARTDKLSFIGPGVFGDAPDTTRVVQVDVLEPNQTAPHSINLEQPPRFPLIPQLKFLNPALAFEVTQRDEIGVDWYRFGQTKTRDLTLILSAPEVRGTFSTFLSDSLAFVPPSPPNPPTYALGPGAWTIGPGSHFCKGMKFEPTETQPESTIVALRGMPPGRLHAIALYTQPGRYGLAVIEGYITSDPAVPRDDHEEDDFCDAADAFGSVVSVPSASYRHTFTIDNPHDVDWIRFTASSPTTVTIKSASRTATTADTSDIDLYLLTVPGATLNVLATSKNKGSTESITWAVGAGDYYVVVVDFRGAPMIYDLCIDTSGCALFPSPPVAPTPRRPLARPLVRPLDLLSPAPRVTARP